MNPAASSDPFNFETVLDGIRRCAEIAIPTQAPAQVNRRVTMIAGGYRERARLLHRLDQTPR